MGRRPVVPSDGPSPDATTVSSDSEARKGYTYDSQLQVVRRIARFRVPLVIALILMGCNETDSFTPNANSSSRTVASTANSTITSSSAVMLATQRSNVLSSTTASCLVQAGPLVTLTGNQKTFDDRKTAVSNLKIDARRASWSGIPGFPVHAGNGKSINLCWQGGNCHRSLFSHHLVEHIP